MDLLAYANIDKLSDLVEKNGIAVERVRGYRLMKDEHIYTKDEVEEAITAGDIMMVERVVSSKPFCTMNPEFYCFSDEKMVKYFITKKDSHGYEEHIAIRWNKLHGKLRKIAKYNIKRNRKRILEAISIWNKYVGCEDVLCIHAKLGSWNWSDIDGWCYKDKEWFLDCCDDIYDEVYCNIFAKLESLE